MRQYVRTEELLVEPLGHLWAAFSASSGETVLLNDEAASVLEVLLMGAGSTDSVCAQLALDSGLAAGSMVEVVEGCWRRLIEAGLVRQHEPDHPRAR